jgi:maltooligosyltrehalose synthase
MKERVCAYARKEEAKVVLVAAPRFLAHLVQMDEMPFGKKTWGNSWLQCGYDHNGPILRIEVRGMKHLIECRDLNHDDGKHSRREKAILNLMA